jgi:cysteinyl-tRNA synthetase
MIKLYNTLIRKKEDFKPIRKGYVGIYTCGPTVYSSQHIGNMRTYIFSDILKRMLEYNGFKIKHIINITDVGHLTSNSDDGEDKMETASKKEGKKAKEIAEKYFNEYLSDFKSLNLIIPDIWSKATKHIEEQINLIKELEKKNYTYKTSDGIYFDSSKFKKYGKFAKLNIKGLKHGKRISIGGKKNKTDFALWKFSETPGIRQQEWNSPWGLGFPGWHIECSAMSMKYLGNNFDIHTGGEDHVQVHHQNEIAQSESLTGKKFVNYWMHAGFLLSDGKKISKSTGGLYTISELEKEGYSAIHFRYLCLLTHYRKQMNFSLENLDSAKKAYERIKRKIIEIKNQKHRGIDRTKIYESKFLKEINNDLNISKALKIFIDSLNDFNFEPKKKLKLLEKFDEILGLGIKDMKEEKIKLPKEVQELIKSRENARKNKNWVESDKFRKKIKQHGFIIEDKLNGYSLKKI